MHVGDPDGDAAWAVVRGEHTTDYGSTTTETNPPKGDQNKSRIVSRYGG